MFVSTSLSCHLVYADSLTHAVHGYKYKTKMGKAGPKIQYGTVINLGPGVLPQLLYITVFRWPKLGGIDLQPS